MEAGLYKETQTKNKFLSEFERLFKTVKKYNGVFNFLWHNTSFYIPELEEINNIYPQLVEIMKNQ